MNMMRRNKVLNLSILALTVFSLIFIIAVTSFAFQGAPGSAPTVKPKMIDPGTGGVWTPDDLAPPDCREPSHFRDCYNSLSRNCASEPEIGGGPAACYQRSYDQCWNVYCK